MRLRHLVVASAVLLHAAVIAEARETYTDQEAGFKMTYPANWKKQINKGGVNLRVSAVDRSVILQVIRRKTKAGASVEKFLDKFEKEMHLGVNQSLGGSEGCSSLADVFPFEECFHRNYITFFTGDKQAQHPVTAFRRGTWMYVFMEKFADEAAFEKYRDGAAYSFEILK